MSTDRIKSLIREGITTGSPLPLAQARVVAEDTNLPSTLSRDVVGLILRGMKSGTRADLEEAIRMLEDYERDSADKEPSGEGETKGRGKKKSTRGGKTKRKTRRSGGKKSKPRR